MPIPTTLSHPLSSFAAFFMGRDFLIRWTALAVSLPLILEVLKTIKTPSARVEVLLLMHTLNFNKILFI